MSNTTVSICEDCARTTSGRCWRHPRPSLEGWPNHSAVPTTKGTFLTPECLCPDLLRHSQLGAADGFRGRVVRAVFFVLRAWPPRR